MAFGRPKGPKHQKARANQAVSEETLATYTAAKGFLISEWFGALLMNVSYAQFSFVLARNGKAAYELKLANATQGALDAAAQAADRSAQWSLALGLVLLAIGAWAYWRSRTYYLRLDFPWRRRWEIGATVLAGAGATFWVIYGLVLLIVSQGGRVG